MADVLKIDVEHSEQLVRVILLDRKGTVVDWSGAEKIRPMGYIAEMGEVIGKMPTHDDWNDLLPMAVIALFAKKFRIDDKIGINYPLVIWPVLLGPSRCGYKSSSVMSVQSVIIRTSEILNLEVICPDEFTGEALLEHLATREWEETDDNCNIVTKTSFTEGPNKYPINWMYQDEWGGWNIHNGAINYMSGTPARMNKIYDNRNTSRKTIAHKLQKIEDPYLILTGCSTIQTFFKILDIDSTFFTQGNGNRYSYVAMEGTDKDFIDIDADFFKVREFSPQANEEIAGFLASIYCWHPTKVQFDDTAQELFIKYRYDTRMKAATMMEKNPNKTEYEYISTLFSFALKYSAIHCINRVIWENKKNGTSYNFTVNAYDMLFAIGLAERNGRHVLKIMDKYVISPIERKFETSHNKKNMVIRFIVDGGRIASQKQLTQKLGEENLNRFREFMKVLEGESRCRMLSPEEVEKIHGNKEFMDAHGFTYKDKYFWVVPEHLDL